VAPRKDDRSGHVPCSRQTTRYRRTGDYDEDVGRLIVRGYYGATVLSAGCPSQGPLVQAMAMGLMGLPDAPVTGRGATTRRHSFTRSAAKPARLTCSSR
jgi:hypothetical protein